MLYCSIQGTIKPEIAGNGTKGGIKMKDYGMGWIIGKTKGSRRYFLLLSVAGVAIGAVNMEMTTVLMNLVNIAAGDLKGSLWENVLWAIFFLMLEGVMGLVTMVSYRMAVSKTGKGLRMELGERLFYAPLLKMQERHGGEYMTCLTTDVEHVADCVPSILRKTVANGLTTLLALIYLFILNWKMACILICVIPLLIFCVAVFSPIVQKMSKQDKENEEKIRVSLQEMLDKILILKTSEMGSVLKQRNHQLLDQKIESAKRLGMAEGGSSFLNNVLGTSMMMIAMAGGAYFVIQGELEVGALIGIVQLANYVVWPFTALGDVISRTNQSIVSARRLGTIYELPQEQAEQGTDPEKEKKQIRGVEVRGVSFSYGEVPVLQSVNADFSLGKVSALIGESGSGKSTLLKIIAGLYTPKNGAVCLRLGKEEKNVQVTGCGYCAFVPADQLIFRDTVAGNICMAQKRQEERMVRCARMANIDQFIDTLENRYDTWIGEGKQAVSSGQMQRIAIARALYQGKKVLLFDEPTANLDTESIDIFIDTLRKISEERVCIVATHDERIRQICQTVYEVKDGKLEGGLS